MKSIQELYPKGTQDTVALTNELNDLSHQIRDRRPIILEANNLYKSIAFDRLGKEQHIFIYRLLTGLSWFIVIGIGLIIDPSKESRGNAVLGVIVVAFAVNIILFLIPTFENPWKNYIINLTWPFIVSIPFGIYASLRKKK